MNGFFLLVDLVFFAANSMKLFQGGWFPLLIAATIAFLTLTWRRGQQISEKARSSLRESEKEFVANLLARPPVRLPGTAAFLTSGTVGIPLTLTHHLKHIYALHERVLLVAVRTSEEPRVPEDERAKNAGPSGGYHGFKLVGVEGTVVRRSGDGANAGERLPLLLRLQGLRSAP